MPQSENLARGHRGPLVPTFSMSTPIARPVSFFVRLLTLVVIGACVHVAQADAASVSRRANELSVSTWQTIKLFDGKFNNGASVAAADVTGDGVDNYVVGPGDSGGARVEIYKQAGNKIAQFYAYPTTMKTGIFVAAGDLDGDGRGEIVVGPQPGYKPEVRIFDVWGNLLKKFTAFEASYTGGVYVAVLPFHDGSTGSIVVGSGVGREPEVRVFSWADMSQTASWFPFGHTFGNGVPVAAAWSDVFNQPIVVAGNGAGYDTKVQVYGLNSGEVLSNWIAYDSRLKTGVNVAVRNDIVATATGAGGGPEIRTFTMDGAMTDGYFAYEKTFRGGALVGLTVVDNALVPVAVPTVRPTSAAATGKSIMISLSKQRLYQYQFGHLIGVHVVSTGKWSTPTPTGRFKTQNKIVNAYSKAYGLYMQSWMAITPDGSVGLHALPYWKLKNGGKLYEGLSHLGTPVSHGCIRQSVQEAKALYDWAPIGTPVTIVR